MNILLIVGLIAFIYFMQSKKPEDHSGTNGTKTGDLTPGGKGLGGGTVVFPKERKKVSVPVYKGPGSPSEYKPDGVPL